VHTIIVFLTLALAIFSGIVVGSLLMNKVDFLDVLVVRVVQLLVNFIAGGEITLVALTVDGVLVSAFELEVRNSRNPFSSIIGCYEVEVDGFRHDSIREQTQFCSCGVLRVSLLGLHNGIGEVDVLLGFVRGSHKLIVAVEQVQGAIRIQHCETPILGHRQRAHCRRRFLVHISLQQYFSRKFMKILKIVRIDYIFQIETN